MNSTKNETLIPVVGMGATYYIGSDRYPYTIIAVNKTGKTICVQRDKATPAEGYDYYSKQVYNYTPNLLGDIEVYTLRKNGRFYRQGETSKYGCLVIGKRNQYQDPSF